MPRSVIQNREALPVVAIQSRRIAMIPTFIEAASLLAAFFLGPTPHELIRNFKTIRLIISTGITLWSFSTNVNICNVLNEKTRGAIHRNVEKYISSTTHLQICNVLLMFADFLLI